MHKKLLLLLFFSACGFGTQTIEELDPNVVPALPEQIVYEDDIDPIMEFYCTACHGAGNVAAQGILLTEEADILAFCNEVIVELFIDQAMPPGGARRLTSSEKALLARWMEFQNQADPEPDPNLKVCSFVSEIP
jgi:uncharacterized membrane protein